MPSASEQQCNDLDALITGTEHVERQCSEFLQFARGLLVEQTSHEFLEERFQYRGHVGDSDYLIVCRVTDGVGFVTTKAYVWELKAPQCYLFVKDTGNRLRPSDDFISAENQLLHYHNEYRESGDFRREFGIVSEGDVKLGGIIIGSRNCQVRGAFETPQLRAAQYQRALAVRNHYIYEKNGVKILDWSTVAQYLRRTQQPVPNVIVPITQPIPITNTTITMVNSGNTF